MTLGTLTNHIAQCQGSIPLQDHGKSVPLGAYSLSGSLAYSHSSCTAFTVAWVDWSRDDVIDNILDTKFLQSRHNSFR